MTVIGAGIMGHGIAQLGAVAGYDVVLTDVDEDILTEAHGKIAASLDKLHGKGHLAGAEPDHVLARLSLSVGLSDAVSGADVVIEAVPELLGAKRKVLGVAAAKAAPGALLATNTSQLSITEIAAGLGEAAPRVIGMHFFNPPVLMRLCELIRGLETSDEILKTARKLAEQLGKDVVVCLKDSPGFITTRAYAALRQECVRMLEEGLASADDIDKALRLGFNFPMGPLELSDFNGVDTYLHVTSALAEAHGDRFRPPISVRNMVAAGRLGRKTGAGFYNYDTNS